DASPPFGGWAAAKRLGLSLRNPGGTTQTAERRERSGRARASVGAQQGQNHHIAHVRLISFDKGTGRGTNAARSYGDSGYWAISWRAWLTTEAVQAQGCSYTNLRTMRNR